MGEGSQIFSAILLMCSFLYTTLIVSCLPIHTSISASFLNGAMGNQNNKQRLKGLGKCPSTTVSCAPIGKILLLCSLGLLNNFGYAVIGAYTAPLLVDAGLQLKYASLLLAISPLLAFVSQAYTGHCSDHCQSSWGRRRPFILLFSILVCVGFGVTPLAPYLSTVNKQIAISANVVGVIVMIYSQATVQLPIRAYQLDCVPPEQIQLSNFVYTLFAGIGITLGFTISALDWAAILNRDINIINEAQGACFVTVALTAVCTILGLCSFTEKSNKDPDSSNNTCCSISLSDMIKINYEIAKFIWHLTKEMWILWLAVFLGFCAEVSFKYFFTTFVGESIYGGNPHAPQNTEAYQKYVEGVRMGSWGLAIGGVLLSIVSVFQNKLADWMGLKTLYIVVQCSFVLASFGLTLHTYYGNNIIIVIMLGSLGGPYLGVLVSVPFTWLHIYQASEHSTAVIVILNM